jgi:molybdate transport system permease protein
VESLEWSQAHWLSGGMLLFSFLVVYTMYLTERRLRRDRA